MLHAAECWDGLAPCRYGCRPTGPVNAGSVARTQLGVRKASCLVVFTSMSPSTRILYPVSEHGAALCDGQGWAASIDAAFGPDATCGVGL